MSGADAMAPLALDIHNSTRQSAERSTDGLGEEGGPKSSAEFTTINRVTRFPVKGALNTLTGPAQSFKNIYTPGPNAARWRYEEGKGAAKNKILPV